MSPPSRVVEYAFAYARWVQAPVPSQSNARRPQGGIMGVRPELRWRSGSPAAFTTKARSLLRDLRVNWPHHCRPTGRGLARGRHYGDRCRNVRRGAVAEVATLVQAPAEGFPCARDPAGVISAGPDFSPGAGTTHRDRRRAGRRGAVA